MGLREEEIKFVNQAMEMLKREMATLPDEAMGAKRPEVNNLEDAFKFIAALSNYMVAKNMIDNLFEGLNKLLGGSTDAEKN